MSVRAEAEGAVLVLTIDRPEARNAVNLAVAEGIASEDSREGARAFAEKRAPVWRGR